MLKCLSRIKEQSHYDEKSIISIMFSLIPPASHQLRGESDRGHRPRPRELGVFS